MTLQNDILPWVRDLGVPISIAAAAGAYIYRTRSEQRRMANRVLYYLLEFRYRFRMMHTNIDGFGKEFIESYTNVWKKYGLELDSASEEIFKQLETLVDQMITNMLVRKASIPEGFAEGFRGALDDLSERDPVTAFGINGSDEVNILVEEIDGYSEQARKLIPEDDPTHSMIDLLKGELNIEKLKEPINELDDTIRGLAKRCGWRTRFRVWRILRKSELKIPKSIREDLDESMEEIVPQIISVVNTLAQKKELQEVFAEKKEALEDKA